MKMTPNHAMKRSAHRRRHWVPVAPRAGARSLPALGLMFSDRQHAVAVSKAAEEFIRQLSLALKAVQANGSEAEVERLRKSIGKVVGALETELLWPLYKKHPDLGPENLKDWQKGS